MSNQQWQVKGAASDIYEEHLVPAYFSEWAEMLISSTELAPGAGVLDVACGTGIVGRKALPLIGPAGKLTGLDLNPTMLEAAGRALELLGGDAKWVEASALDMPLPDNAFDNVFCQCGIMFFPDRGRAMREMYRVLSPGGHFAANVWRALKRTPGFSMLERAIANHISDEAAAIVRSPFSIDSPAELSRMVSASGMGNVHVSLESRMARFPSTEAFFKSYVNGSPLAGHVTDAVDCEAIVQEMDDRLGEYIDDDGLAFPIEGMIVTGRK